MGNNLYIRDETFILISLWHFVSFQAFSADQYKSMQAPQVQAISSARKETLSMAQQDAIKSVIDSDPDEEDPWGPDEDDDDHDCSGTPPMRKIIYERPKILALKTRNSMKN